MDAIRLPPHLRANLSRERKLMRCGHGTIAGIDEVGRGPLAGPVVAAAVVLDMKRVPKGLADSKVLTLEEREALFDKIVATAQIGIASISHLEIDVINIRQASLSAMCRALAALPCRPDIALVDGNDPPRLPCRVETIVKGDARVASIAAASGEDRRRRLTGARAPPPRSRKSKISQGLGKSCSPKTRRVFFAP